MHRTLQRIATAAGILVLCACFPGGLVDKGGYVDNVAIIPAATLTRGAPYRILCWDAAEMARREKAGIRTMTKAEREAEAKKKSAGKSGKEGDSGEKKTSGDPSDQKAEGKSDKKPGGKNEKSDKTETKTSDDRESGVILGPPVREVSAQGYTGGCEQEGEHSVFFLLNLFPVSKPLDVEYAISTAVQRLEGDTMINLRVWHEVHYYSVLGRAAVVKVRGDVIRFAPVVEPEPKKEGRRGRRRRR